MQGARERRSERVNDPHDDHEQRIQKLEQDRNDIVESERLLLRLARLHRVSLQELKAQFEVEAGDVRQRFDTIEQMVSAHDKRFDSIEQTQATHTDVLNKLVTLAESHEKRFDKQDERFDRLEATMQEILARLPKQE
jgi:methyl-accepting chemotaxis protein